MAAIIPGANSNDIAPSANIKSNDIGGISVDKIKNVLPEMIAGSLKGNTTDLLGLPVDMIHTILTSVGIKLPKPTGGADSIRKLLGIKSTEEDTAGEVGGSLLSPAGAAKAMIVGLGRVATKAGVAPEAIAKIQQTARDALQLAGTKARVFDSSGAYAVNSDDVIRTVLSSANAKVNPKAAVLSPGTTNVNITGGSKQLSELLQYDELYSLYPELKDYKVRTVPSKQVGSATHYPVNKVIEMGPSSSIDELRSVLLHETQHAVQTAEGMQAGATPQDFMRVKRPSPEKIASIQNMAASSDKSLSKAANRFLVVLDKDAAQSYQSYLKVPGESEARFAQKTRDMSQKDLNTEVSRMLSSDIPHSLWDR